QPRTPDANRVTVRRPLLAYPAYPCTGVANAVADLIADLPAAKAKGREPSLPDPDVTAVQVDVQVRALGFDPQSDSGYVPLYRATRDFPAVPGDSLTLQVDWRDVHDATALSDPGFGALPAPTSRDVRFVVSALGRPDPHHDYFGADDVRVGPPAGIDLRRAARNERALLVTGPPADFVRALYLQPDPLDDPTLAAATSAAGQAGQPGDSLSRVAAALDLDSNDLALRAKPGTRLVFGAAAGLRHSLGPDHGSVTVASRSELTRQWVVALRARIDRDWTWSGIADSGIAVLRDGSEVGRLQPVPTLTAEGEALGADRTSTELLFLDIVDTRPSAGTSPRPTTVTYELRADWVSPPAQSDDPLATQDITLPVTTTPAQAPHLVAVGVALSPYLHSPDYASTQRRSRMLWLQLDGPPADADDRYFARVLRSTPDPLLTGGEEDAVPDQPVEPPLPIDAEYTRVIVPGQSDDRAGAGAMQELIPGDQPGYYLLPLPPGVHHDDPSLLGFWTYEFRVGHGPMWSTAQGRFGHALRVAGVQHPAPILPCTVARFPTGLVASAPYASPVYNGTNLRPFPPATQIWIMLYTQVERADRGERRNILLGRRLARLERKKLYLRGADGSTQLSADAAWSQYEIAALLDAVGMDEDSPLSVLAVEMLPNEQPSQDPLGADLGAERILRTSVLVAAPEICISAG
ncbi:MAG: hypothetical protein ACRDZY_01545, partial [Acidimicrobiales bacterium]